MCELTEKIHEGPGVVWWWCGGFLVIIIPTPVWVFDLDFDWGVAIIYPTYFSKLYLDPNIKNGSKNKIDTEIALIFSCIFSCFHVFWHFKDRCQLDVYIQCWYVWKWYIKMSHCQWKKLISHSFLSDIQPEQLQN